MLPKISLLSALIGAIIAFIIVIPFKSFNLSPTSEVKISTKKQLISCWALLGDVGGTNIRLELVLVNVTLSIPNVVIKTAKYKVQNFDKFSDAIKQFLSGLDIQPSIAVIAIAGAVTDNSVKMGNVPKWGLISGNQLGKQLNISYFKIINDFQGASYGILPLVNEDFISLNNKTVDQIKKRGVIGPGTGLGSSVLYPAPYVLRRRIYVLPTQGGQADFYHVDNETTEFFDFLKKTLNLSYINIQRACTGPSLPLIYKFLAQKLPEQLDSDKSPKSQEITNWASNNHTLAKKAIGFYVKMYGIVIGNFMVNHLPIGGVYLVGSVTKAILPYLQQVDILKDFRQRHPQVGEIVSNIPIVFCKDTQLGLKGAYVCARRILSDMQQTQS